MVKYPYRRSHGFTMIELMVTLVVLGVLVGVGIPSFNTIMVNSRTSGLANDLTSAINLARSEAVKRAEQVTVCPSSNPNDEDPKCDANASWTDGWIVADASNNALRVWQSPSPSAVIQSSTSDKPINFGDLGELVSDPVEVIVRMDGCRGQRARQLDIVRAGRVGVTRVECPE